MFNIYRNFKYLIVGILPLLSSCKKTNLIEKSGQWDQIRYGELIIENNTWNIQAVKGKWSEIIFCDTIKGIMGWRWDFSNENSNYKSTEVKTFPEIIFGKKPYNNYQSTTSKLPVKLSSAQFRIKYEYIKNTNGIYNTSTDISFCDSINPIEKNIRAKMMIWFDHQNFPFYKSEKLIIDNIGGLQYKVFIDTTHVGPEGKWIFIALLSDRFPSKGELNLNEYFEYFLTKGILKPEWYLSSIEIGSEISSGKGEIIFKKFEIY